MGSDLTPTGRDGPKRSRPALAYVFWHRPSETAAVPTYESDLLSFHASLAACPPEGFVRSWTSLVRGASWLPMSGVSYEDWFLVRGWAALGDLNHDAVAPAHGPCHARVAHQALDGAGGLYALRAGDDAREQTQATWFAKPPGWSYDELGASLHGCLTYGVALWQRQMVLGPAPGYCLRGNRAPTLPAPLSGQHVACRALDDNGCGRRGP